MTVIRILAGIGLWTLLAAPVALLLGRIAARRDEVAEPDEIECDCWSQAAIDAEFDLMKPGLVTADVFHLDAQINRRARGWVA